MLSLAAEGEAGAATSLDRHSARSSSRGVGSSPSEGHEYHEMAVMELAMAARRKLAYRSDISFRAGSKASFQLGSVTQSDQRRRGANSTASDIEN